MGPGFESMKPAIVTQASRGGVVLCTLSFLACGTGGSPGGGTEPCAQGQSCVPLPDGGGATDAGPTCTPFPEACDGIDNDGDGFPGLDAQNVPVDCDDMEALVNPGAIEVPGDGGTQTPSNPRVLLQAMGLCGPSVQSVTTVGNDASRAVRTRLGTNFTPLQGQWMLHMSSGYARDRLDPSSWSPQHGQDLGQASPHPLWSAPSCGPGGQVNTARDLSEITLTMKVPTNAQSFSFDFNFFSAEYPEWVCDRYEDRFVVLLSSSPLNPQGLVCRTIDGRSFCNVSFDGNGNPLTVNNNFFRICNGTGCTQSGATLAGTGYEGGVGGATGWLNTRAPVTPGETLILKFAIFDEGDGILDTAALIDNFQWESTPVDAPTTIPIN